MSIARHHAEWLSLVEVSGPFLSMPVLLEAFPQGLEAHDPDHHRLLRLAHGEWEAKLGDVATHNAWIRFILRKTLDYTSEALLEGQQIPQTLHATVAEQHEILQPDIMLIEPATCKPRLLVQIYPRNQDLTKPVPGLSWKASPDTRMTELLHQTGVRLGLVTNGERWIVVDAPKGETSGFASWYSNLWLEEPITLRAFRSLLGLHRFFGVDEKATLEELLKKSAANQQEVTDQLGYQVRRAVEVLIQSLDRADQDHRRELLQGVKEGELYEAALTVMMRLVFLFCAEERELLLLGDPLYNQNYALSTIREQLRTAADQFGEEVLERRHDAWCRLLVNFRAVHGGVWHDNFKLPPYGGRLFDPDRFPFLEGRKPGTTWKDTEATPLPVNNRTVLHLLEALQLLQMKVPGGGAAEARRLSFRALDIEQIGHVYEGLLDHTAKRAGEPYLGLAGTKDQEPEIPLAKLEELQARGEKDLVKFLKEETGRSEAAIKKAMKTLFDTQAVSRFRSACQGDEAQWLRVQPFAGLVRLDSFGYPVVIPMGCVFVTEGTDRRSSGTHYTPRSLTEPIVQYTLEPLVYVGPAEGVPKDQWKLKSARELLDLKVCDMACGSGAFLVQACRYLSERLLEAWDQAEKDAQPRQQGNLFVGSKSAQHDGVRITPYGMFSVGGLYEQLVPLDMGERLTYARRIVAQRCLYGVDKNPLAVEMAKLSLWLLTLAKDKPFEFLDHAIRCGDSLVGIHHLDQLKHLNLTGLQQVAQAFVEGLERTLMQAQNLREQLESVNAFSVEQVEQQEQLYQQSQLLTVSLKAASDLLIADAFTQTETGLVKVVTRFANGKTDDLVEVANKALQGKQTFHWPLEFPEVLQKRGGFDAFVCNPPFMGGTTISSRLGKALLTYLTLCYASRLKSGGRADLCAYFVVRMNTLLRRPGCLGLITTNTISQGDTREVGLDTVLGSGSQLIRAVATKKWPGTASLEVSQLWFQKGEWRGQCMLDGQPVSKIDALLTSHNRVNAAPFRLAENMGNACEGSKPMGMGFAITPEEARTILSRCEKSRDVLFPYINGDDFMSSPTQEASRWIVNFFDWPEAKAQGYSACWQIVEERVRPYRQEKNEQNEYIRRSPLPEKFWLYGDSRMAFYRKIKSFRRVLVAAQTSKYVSLAFQPNDRVFGQTTIMIAVQDDGRFAALSSTIHAEWIMAYCSSLKKDPRYLVSDGYETFPQPKINPRCEEEGKAYHSFRSQVMLARQEGLTKTYNRFHEPGETSDDIQQLRQFHVQMNHAVAVAYDWTDLDLGHGFHQTKQGLRYTISEPARREVLARLLKLNHERYAEEVRQGQHNKKSSGKGRAKKGTANDEGTPRLFSLKQDIAQERTITDEPN